MSSVTRAFHHQRSVSGNHNGCLMKHALKLPRLGETLEESVKRAESDPKFIEAKRLYKGTPGKVCGVIVLPILLALVKAT